MGDVCCVMGVVVMCRWVLAVVRGCVVMVSGCVAVHFKEAFYSCYLHLFSVVIVLPFCPDGVWWQSRRERRMYIWVEVGWVAVARGGWKEGRREGLLLLPPHISSVAWALLALPKILCGGQCT